MAAFAGSTEQARRFAFAEWDFQTARGAKGHGKGYFHLGNGTLWGKPHWLRFVKQQHQNTISTFHRSQRSTHYYDHVAARITHYPNRKDDANLLLVRIATADGACRQRTSIVEAQAR